MALMPMLEGREAIVAILGVVKQGRGKGVLAERGVHRSFK
jgi:hypothetical protein